MYVKALVIFSSKVEKDLFDICKKEQAKSNFSKVRSGRLCAV